MYLGQLGVPFGAPFEAPLDFHGGCTNPTIPLGTTPPVRNITTSSKPLFDAMTSGAELLFDARTRLGVRYDGYPPSFGNGQSGYAKTHA